MYPDEFERDTVSRPPVLEYSKAPSSSKDDLPRDVKKDIIQAYLLVKRSQEELSLLAEEKLNILSYWMEQKVFINQQIDTLH